MGVAGIIVLALGLGFLMRPKSHSISSVSPAKSEQQEVRNDARTPVGELSEGRELRGVVPVDAEEMNDARNEPDRRTADKASRAQSGRRVRGVREEFYPVEKSRQFTNQTIEYLTRAGDEVRAIDWSKKVWTPDMESELSQFLKPNYVLEVTRTVGEAGAPASQSIYVLIRSFKKRSLDAPVLTICGPLTGTPEWEQYPKGVAFPGDLSSLLDYLNHPTVTGVYGPVE